MFVVFVFLIRWEYNVGCMLDLVYAVVWMLGFDGFGMLVSRCLIEVLLL